MKCKCIDLFVGVNYKDMMKSLHHVIRDRTDQLDNKDIAIATKEFIEKMNNVETILDSFRCSYNVLYLSFENIQLFIVER